MNPSQIKNEVIRKFYRIPVAPRSTTIREWEKLDPDQILTLLQNCSPLAHHRAKELITNMARTRWTLTATAHDMGSRTPGDKLHISIKIGNKRPHHLYCKEIAGRGLQITRITAG